MPIMCQTRIGRNIFVIADTTSVLTNRLLKMSRKDSKPRVHYGTFFEWIQKERSMESGLGKKTIGQPWTPPEVPGSIIIPQSWTDGRTIQRIKIPRKQLGGMKPTACIWTTWAQSTFRTRSRITRESATHNEERKSRSSSRSSEKAGSLQRDNKNVGESYKGTRKSKFLSY